ncbi:hypothetical protein Tco_0969877 [Tanacetum coccineum]
MGIGSYLKMGLEDKNWKYQEQLCLDCPVECGMEVILQGPYNETLVEKACANCETVPCEQFDIELQVMDLEATNGRDWGEIKDHKLFNEPYYLEDIKEHFTDQLHQSKSKAVGAIISKKKILPP